VTELCNAGRDCLLALHFPLAKHHAELRLRFFNSGSDCELHTLIHTSSFEILLPHIVVILPELDIKISAIDLYSLPLTNILDLHTIYELL
jgi:hypothetical protein